MDAPYGLGDSSEICVLILLSSRKGLLDFIHRAYLHSLLSKNRKKREIKKTACRKERVEIFRETLILQELCYKREREREREGEKKRKSCKK